ncbi:MAG TPA: hypothetical protein VHL85_09160 [Burkholderiales bacterium]|jgi:hypothetical protein|nr:hypothetical protein [Burkholderiales bacterium]
MAQRRRVATGLRAEPDSFAQDHVYARKKRAQFLIATDFQAFSTGLGGAIHEKSTNLSTAFVDIAKSTTADRRSATRRCAMLRRRNLPQRETLP